MRTSRNSSFHSLRSTRTVRRASGRAFADDDRVRRRAPCRPREVGRRSHRFRHRAISPRHRQLAGCARPRHANRPACDLVAYRGRPGSRRRSRAANWGNYGEAIQLGEFLYEPFDSAGPDDRSWRGPYLDRYTIPDPWGNADVINARYLPNGKYAGRVRHSVLVLSSGPDQKWQTPYSDSGTEDTRHGDDIAVRIRIAD